MIILSVIAIIGAGVLWAWPDHDKEPKHAKNVDLGPAPDRMNTESLPPSPPPLPVPAPTPAPKTAAPPVDTPAPIPPPPKADDNGPIEHDLADPWSSHTQIPDFNDLLKDPKLLENLDPRAGLALSALTHLCTRAQACGTDAGSVCDAVATLPKAPPPACPAAQRCLEHLDQLTCSDADPSSMKDLLLLSTDCTEAARC